MGFTHGVILIADTADRRNACRIDEPERYVKADQLLNIPGRREVTRRIRIIRGPLIEDLLGLFPVDLERNDVVRQELVTKPAGNERSRAAESAECSRRMFIGDESRAARVADYLLLGISPALCLVGLFLFLETSDDVDRTGPEVGAAHIAGGLAAHDVESEPAAAVRAYRSLGDRFSFHNCSPIPLYYLFPKEIIPLQIR